LEHPVVFGDLLLQSAQRAEGLALHRRVGLRRLVLDVVVIVAFENPKFETKFSLDRLKG
jgi:hypothetical protein